MVDSSVCTSRVSIELVQSAITSASKPRIENAGAVLCFHGVVRPYEEGRLLKGLEYTSYDPMAEQQLYRLAQRAVDRHQLFHVQIVHSLGFVAVQEVSLLLVVASKHRKSGLLAVDEILNDLKRDVPIWKSPVFADASETDH